MKTLTSTTAVVTLLLTITEAIALSEPEANLKVLSYDVVRRDTTPDLTVDNPFNGIFYTMNLTIGNPPQNVAVVIDTGSANLIVNDDASDWCQAGNCTGFGGYDPNQSPEHEWVSDGMVVQYELGGGTGSWLRDSIEMGGITVSKFQFGVANKSSTNPQNYLGLGYMPVAGITPGAPSYPTLVTLAKQGLIKSATASIYLNQTGSATGSLLLGGVDTSLYTGNLQALPIIPSNGTFDRLAVNVSSVTTTGSSSIATTDEFPFRVMLDTGNFDIKLPPKITANIWAAYGITVKQTIGPATFGLCNCTLGNSKDVLSFNFDSVNITVPMKSLAISPPAAILAAFGVPANMWEPSLCIFGINSLSDYQINSQGLPFILGGAFISNAYVVLDQEAQQIALAQANFNPGPSKIKEIASGSGGLAGIATSPSSGSSNSSGSASAPSPSSTTSSAPEATPTKNAGALTMVHMPSTVAALLASALFWFL